MKFNIIDITNEELEKLTVAQMKMLRTAQQKKNELYHNAAKDLEMFKRIVMSAGMRESTLLEDKKTEIYDEVEYKCAIIADNLLYNMSLNEPTHGGNIGGGDEGAGYIVDYSLSYSERYIIVRDYYLAIQDPNERMARYAADEVEKKYLGTYYQTLYNVLYSYSK